MILARNVGVGKRLPGCPLAFSSLEVEALYQADRVCTLPAENANLASG